MDIINLQNVELVTTNEDELTVRFISGEEKVYKGFDTTALDTLKISIQTGSLKFAVILTDGKTSRLV